MLPSRITVAPFSVTGIAVRTINRDEFNPASARLPQLWQRFAQEDVAARVAGAGAALADCPVYGVYADYESDAGGHYTVTAGIEGNPLADSSFSTVAVVAGEYLVFSESGAMPQAVITAWTRVWAYFEAHPQCRRLFQTDFEKYIGGNEVAIHIGIAP